MSNEKRMLGDGGIFERERIQMQVYNYTKHKFPEENYLKTFGLHHYRYPTNMQSEGIVFFFHDQSKYCGKYAYIAEMMAQKGLEVVGFDLPGHGHNQDQPRGYFGTYDDVERYSHEFIEQTIKKLDYENKPKFAIGVSTGSLTCLHLAMERERFFNGINVVNPLLKNEGVHPRFYKYCDFLGKVRPKLKMMKIDLQSLQPFEDPLMLKGSLRAGLFKELDDMSYFIRNNASKITTPLLVAHGGIDTITTPKVVRKFFEKVVTQDKDIILYDD